MNNAILGVGFIFSCQNKFENVSLAKEPFSVLNLPVSARNGGSQGFPHVISPKTSKLGQISRILLLFSFFAPTCKLENNETRFQNSTWEGNSKLPYKVRPLTGPMERHKKCASPIHKSDWTMDIIIVCYLKGSENGPLFS